MPAKKKNAAISSDGKRYTDKPAGSMFGGGMRTVSCFKCGVHKDRAEGVFAKILGKPTFFCNEVHREQVVGPKKVTP